jgi:hypothetical protein
MSRYGFIKPALWGLMIVALTTVALAIDPPMPRPRRADRMPAPITAPVEAPAPAPADQVETETPAVEALEQATLPPQPVKLEARITESGGALADGVTWRIFETRTNAQGDLVLVAKSEEAQPRLQLVPGNYVIHLAYGRAQTTDTLAVKEGGTNKAVVLDAGGLRLNAAVTGDIAIPINLLRFDVYTGASDTSGQLVAESLSPNDIVTLSAGTYHVISYFGDVNAVVRADLQVEPGKLTDATVFHKASQVAFKLVSEPGGEAIADVDWTIKTVDGTVVYSSAGSFPSTVLAEGDYVVFAKKNDVVYNRAFQILPGAGSEIEVLTAVYQGAPAAAPPSPEAPAASEGAPTELLPEATPEPSP